MINFHLYDERVDILGNEIEKEIVTKTLCCCMVRVLQTSPDSFFSNLKTKSNQVKCQKIWSFTILSERA